MNTHGVGSIGEYDILVCVYLPIPIQSRHQKARRHPARCAMVTLSSWTTTQRIHSLSWTCPVVWGTACVAYWMTSVGGERGQCWSWASSACVLSDFGRRLRLVRCWNRSNSARGLALSGLTWASHDGQDWTCWRMQRCSLWRHDVIGPAGAGGGALSGQLFQCVGLASASSHAWARPGERYKNPARCSSRRGEEDREAVRVRMVDRGGQLIGQL